MYFLVLKILDRYQVCTGRFILSFYTVLQYKFILFKSNFKTLLSIVNRGRRRNDIFNYKNGRARARFPFVVLLLFFFVFAPIIRPARIDHGLTCFGGHPKSFRPSRAARKRDAGTRRWQRARWLTGPGRSCARVRIFNLLRPPPLPFRQKLWRRRRRRRIGAAKVSALSMCTLLSHIYDPGVPHPQ